MRYSFFDFAVLDTDKYGPRLGNFFFQGRKTIKTPHFLALGSRGAVPHMSQDMLCENTHINCLYTALEDCKYRKYRISVAQDIIADDMLLLEQVRR